MPPKKKQEEIDPATLPPWFSLHARLLFRTRKEREEVLIETLKEKQLSFKKIVDRNVLTEYAKEKGLYFDPETLTDKQKKDPKFLEEANIEMTATVFAKSAFGLLEEWELNGRKEKKEMMEEKEREILEAQLNAQPPPPKKESKVTKKETKIDIPPPVTEPVEKEKDYSKTNDTLIFFVDYPTTKEEIQALSDMKVPIHCFYRLTEMPPELEPEEDEPVAELGDVAYHRGSRLETNMVKTDRSFYSSRSHVPKVEEIKVEKKEEDIKVDGSQKDEDEEEKEEGEEVQVEEEKPYYQDQDFQHMQSVNLCVQALNEIKMNPESKPIIRDCYLNDAEGEEIEEPANVLERIIEELSSFSFDVVAYNEWKKERQKSDMVKLYRPEIPAELLNALMGGEDPTPPKKAKNKKEQEQLDKEELEKKKRKEAELKEMLEEMRPKLTDLSNFRQKVSKIPQNKLTGGVLLTHLLEHLITKERESDDEEEEGELVFEDENFNTSKQKETLQQIKIVEINDGNNPISKKSPEDMNLLSEFCLPGIERYMMPENPEKSEEIRHVERCQVYPFSEGNILKYERIDKLKKLEKIAEKFRRGQKFDFSDRKIEELHNKQTSIDTFLNILEYTPHSDFEYQENFDSLLVTFLHHNPEESIARYQITSPWRVLPNLDFWIKSFKNNDDQANNQMFYNMDLWEAGPVQERTKYIYPPNNSYMLSRKTKLGLTETKQGILICGDLKLILKDNLLQGDEYSTTFYIEKEADFYSLTIKLDDGDVIKFQDENEIIFENKKETRLVVSKGTVIKYNKVDSSREILYANGNYSSRDLLGNWTTTNNKGFRKIKFPNGEQKQLEEIPCAHRTDPKSKTRVMIREDKVISLNYANGEVFTQHKDSTRMMTRSSETIVEHPDFSTVRIVNGITEEGNQDIEEGIDNCIKRICDIVDGSQVRLYYDDNSEIVKNYLLSSGTRLIIKKNGNCNLINKDFNYHINLEEGTIYCEDSDKCYKLFKSGDCKIEELNPPEQPKNQLDIPEEFERPTTPIFEEDINGIESIEEDPDQDNLVEGNDRQEELNHEPNTSFKNPSYQGIKPRLFEVFSDGIAKEFLCEEMVASFKSIFERENNTEIFVIENQEFKTHIFLKRDESLKNKRKVFIEPQIPELDILRGDASKFITKPLLNLKKNYYLLRCLNEYSYPSENDIVWFNEKSNIFNEWKRSTRYKAIMEFGVGPKEIESIKYDAHINSQILKARGGNYQSQNFNELKGIAKNMLFERLQSYLNKIILKAKESIIELESIERSKSTKKDKVEVIEEQPVITETHQTEEIEHKIFRTMHIGFVPNYFDTFFGKEFLENNDIPDPPAPNTDKSQEEATLKDLEANGELDDQNEGDQMNFEDEDDEYGDIIEYDEAQQAKSMPKIMKKGLTESVFRREEYMEAKREEDERKKLEKQMALKGKNYNVYGNERKDFKPLKILERPVAKAELNQKYILTDSATERRVRTVSQCKRHFFKAANLEEMRHTGPHQIMLNATDKKNTIEGLLERRTIMITSDIDDKKKRDLLIKPEFVDFGTVRRGSFYETVITLQNEDVIPQRITLRNPRSKFIKVIQIPKGLIAMGMSCKVFIRIDTTNMKNLVEDEFEIITRFQIYKIPVNIIVSTAEENFKKKLAPGVRELKIKREEFVDSNSSDFLPKITGIDRQYKLGTVDQYMKHEDQNYKKDEEDEFNY